METQQENPYFLFPGALYVSSKPMQITTVLGSCVAICLYDPVKHIGGMNHFMLPLWNGKGLASPKHGNIAISKLIDQMVSAGALKRNLKAKVFGGGIVIQTQSAQFNIGKKNIDLAFRLLEQEGIPVIASSTGGNHGRKILYDTYTGKVKQKIINNIHEVDQINK